MALANVTYMGKRVSPGIDDLATTMPELAREWHPTKNGDVTPHDVMAGTNKKAWWLCHEGHVWEAMISNRGQGHGCPVCAGQVLLPGYNDLASTNPELAREWHPTKNGDLAPQDVMAGTNRKVWWLCPLGHEWLVSCAGRKVRGRGCPVCAGQVVLPGYNDLASTNPELACEWHPTKNEDTAPSSVSAGSGKKVWWRCSLDHDWEAAPFSRVRGSGCPVCSGQRVLPGYNDLATTMPELAREWHPTKNGDVTPHDVMAGTNKKAWWLCHEGHVWEAMISNRGQGHGCPVCAGKAVLPGYNDLATTNPELAGQWHPTKNGELSPQDLVPGSNRGIWWLCDQGHEWRASPSSRTGRRSGCPVCSGRVTSSGYNDLATTHPELAREWHPTKNGETVPGDVAAGSGKKAWWICPLGHEWQATGDSRVRGSGCPVCGGQRVLPGYNDLATTHPELVPEWHPTKNGNTSPGEVAAGSGKKAWWICPLGHEWQATGDARIRGSGCPVCAMKTILPGYNDLATTHPELVPEWHPTKNGNVKPTDLLAGSDLKTWWVCSLGHEWQARTASRGRGYGCPVCAGQVCLPGYNDVATTHPELAAQWHPTKNDGISPSSLSAGSGKKVWWLCEEGHAWAATVSNRAIGQGCPTCATFGFDPSKPGILYFIAHRVYRARKVGITNVGTSRLKAFSKAGWEQLHAIENTNGSLSRAVEAAVFEWLRGELQLPPYLGRDEMLKTGGWTETFSMEGPSDAEVIARIEAEFAARDPGE